VIVSSRTNPRYLSCGLGLLLILSPSHAAEGPDASADLRKPGTIKMAALLERLARQANPMGNLFLSRERVAAMRSALASSPAMSNSPETQFSFSTELLNAGENEKAIEVFEPRRTVKPRDRRVEGRQ
jgi:hypothetical protein